MLRRTCLYIVTMLCGHLFVQARTPNPSHRPRQRPTRRRPHRFRSRPWPASTSCRPGIPHPPVSTRRPAGGIPPTRSPARRLFIAWAHRKLYHGVLQHLHSRRKRTRLPEQLLRRRRLVGPGVDRRLRSHPHPAVSWTWHRPSSPTWAAAGTPLAAAASGGARTGPTRTPSPTSSSSRSRASANRGAPADRASISPGRIRNGPGSNVRHDQRQNLINDGLDLTPARTTARTPGATTRAWSSAGWQS